MTIHRDMFGTPVTPLVYPSPLVWLGTWNSPRGLGFHGFHVWDRMGNWHGVYKTQSRAAAEATKLT